MGVEVPGQRRQLLAWRVRFHLLAALRAVAWVIWAGVSLMALGDLPGFGSDEQSVRVVGPLSTGDLLRCRPMGVAGRLSLRASAGAPTGRLHRDVVRGDWFWQPAERWRRAGVGEVLVAAGDVATVRKDTYLWGRRASLRIETRDGKVLWCVGPAAEIETHVVAG